MINVAKARRLIKITKQACLMLNDEEFMQIFKIFNSACIRENQSKIYEREEDIKDILEIETPENCYECPVSDLHGYASDHTIYCGVLSENDSECPEKARREDCPLRRKEGMKGHIEKNLGNGIIMTSFNPEYRTTMEIALEEYKKFKEQLPRQPQDEVYSFAYWLFRYSGLIEPIGYKDDATD